MSRRRDSINGSIIRREIVPGRDVRYRRSDIRVKNFAVTSSVYYAHGNRALARTIILFVDYTLIELA